MLESASPAGTDGLLVDPFVGRELELAQLHAGLADALRRRGRLVLVSGDPGIGKTRLADEIARSAVDEGAAVLWGRCWEERGAPPYWPWIEIIRDCLHEDGPEVTLRRMGSGARHLAQIVPEVRDALAGAPAEEAADAARNRFLLFDALTSFLVAASRERPLVLILDDLHAGDVPSLLLLAFLARQVRRLRALVYGAYREPEAQARPEVADLLGQVAREGITLRLAGLDRGEVRRVLEGVTGLQVPDVLVGTVHDVTEGNPLFVSELARLLGSKRDALREGLDPGIALAAPETVRHTIRRRVALLSDEAVTTLSSAAVFGREFESQLLLSVVELEADQLAQQLQEAVLVGAVSPVSNSEGRYTFTHGLIREVLYDGLPHPRRLELHLRIGHALERHHHGDLPAHVTEVAHHFLQAAQAGGAELAVHHSVEAAEQAVGQFAYEEGADWYRRALAALDLRDTVDDSRRCDLELSLGRALARAGRSGEARETFLRSRAIARALGSPDRLAQAALGYGWVAQVTGVADPVLIRLLEEALTALGDHDSALRVDVMTRLVIELVYADEPALLQRRSALAREAMAVARRVDEPMALIYAIEALAWAEAGPDNVSDRLAAGEEIIRLAQEHDEVLTGAPMGHLLRFPALLELGELEGAQRELRAYERVAETLQEPDLVWYVTVGRTTLALLAGDLERAERLGRQALEIGDPGRAEEARQYFGVQLLTLLRERGTSVNLADQVYAFEDLAGRFPTLPALQAAVGCVYADLGREPAARATLQRLATDMEQLPRGTTWLVTLALLAELCARLRAADLAAQVYRLMAPYASHNVVFDAAVVCLGSASRYLGLLAATMGELDEAAAHFEDAGVENTRLGARPALAHTQHEHAELLLARKAPGDRERARALLVEALESARDVGMVGLEVNAATLLESLPGGKAEGSAAAPPIAAVFRQEGDYWSIVYGSERLHLRDTKGLRYLGRLLGCPGAEVHVLDLVMGDAAAGPPDVQPIPAEDGLSVGSDDAGPILDPQAKAAYRQRLADLREEVDEAEAMNDPERAARAHEEMDFLSGELAAAVGLGGRDRKAASASERARVNVTRTIKLALDRIAEQSPDLGEHLTLSVKTGTFCSYRPDPRARVVWTR